MAKSPDSVLLALIATLEERAKKNGEKSIVKSLVGRLAKTGASPELIGEISALRPAKAVKAKASPKANGKTKAAVSEPVSVEAPAAAVG